MTADRRHEVQFCASARHGGRPTALANSARGRPHQGMAKVWPRSSWPRMVGAPEVDHPAVVVADEERHQVAIGVDRADGGRLAVAHEPAVALHVGVEGGPSADRRRLVVAHQATVALDVGVENRGELAFHYWSPGLRARLRQVHLYLPSAKRLRVHHHRARKASIDQRPAPPMMRARATPSARR
jgi:hypothetical protein